MVMAADVGHHSFPPRNAAALDDPGYVVYQSSSRRVLKTTVLSTTPCNSSVPGPLPNATTSSTVTSPDFVEIAAGSDCSCIGSLVSVGSWFTGSFAAPYDFVPLGPVAQVIHG